MQRLAHSLLCLLALGLAACPRAKPANTPPDRISAGVDAADLAKLTIPPGDEALAILQALAQQADSNAAISDRTEAAWHRVHYLMDLFDAARFGGDKASRNLLAKVAGRPPGSMSGTAATQAIAELLVLEVDHVLELNREHSLGQQARTLATFDADPPGDRRQVFQRVEELKRVVAKQSAMSVGARLRLFGYCRVALEDAADFVGQARRIALSHCLYPLFASDPAPYFHDKAERRPPPPQIRELLRVQGALIRVEGAGRLAAAVEAQESWRSAFESSVSQVPTLDPISLRLPPARHVHPYDDYPLVPMGIEAAAANPVLQGLLLSDGRGVAAVALASEKSATQTLQAAQIASRAGAQGFAILVAMQQRLSVPKGDYWSGKIQQESHTRAGEFLLSLALFGDKQTGRDTQSAKATAWDPSRASLALHLMVAPGRWRLAGPSGLLATIDTATGETHPRDLLRDKLREIRRAYPDEDGLILVPESGTSHGALVAAAQAAQHDAEGRPLFSQLALRARAPAFRQSQSLRKRVALRARATVSVVPEVLALRLPIARRCYLQSLDKGRPATGEIRIEGDDKGNLQLIKGKGKGMDALATCAQKAFWGQILDQELGAATVTFALGPESPVSVQRK